MHRAVPSIGAGGGGGGTHSMSMPDLNHSTTTSETREKAIKDPSR